MKVFALTVAEGVVRERFLTPEGTRAKRQIPVGAFLLEHPAGRVLVDAGPPPVQRVLLRAIRSVRAGRFSASSQGLPQQLARHGVPPETIAHIVLTHLHWDHAGALREFPQAEVHVAGAELDALLHHGGWRLRYAGVALPAADRIRRVDFTTGPAWGPFAHTHDLFGDGQIRLVPTPGHTPGHLAVVVAPPGEPPLIICGDACYLASALRRGTGNGSTLGRPQDRNVAVAAVTQARLRELLELHPGARLLPSHDPEVWAELPRWPQPLPGRDPTLVKPGKP